MRTDSDFSYQASKIANMCETDEFRLFLSDMYGFDRMDIPNPFGASDNDFIGAHDYKACGRSEFAEVCV